MRTRRILQISLWVAALVWLATFGVLQFGLLPKPQQSSPLAVTTGVAQIGGPFRLESHKGEVVTDQTLKGRPSAIFFGFTHCPEVCPTTLFDLTGLLQELGPDAEKITPVLITVDPERDTKSVLAEYMQSFDPRILALTGSPADVDAAAKAFKVFYRKVPADKGSYTMDHSAVVYLMDREGRFAGSLDKHEPKEAQLRKLKALIENSSPT